VLGTDGKFLQPWSGWFRHIYEVFNSHGVEIANAQQAAGQAQQDVQTVAESLAAGIGVTVTIAALTTGAGPHATGHMTFHNGILTEYVAAT
jgi:ketopantoate hydroxymethyltransferase